MLLQQVREQDISFVAPSCCLLSALPEMIPPPQTGGNVCSTWGRGVAGSEVGSSSSAQKKQRSSPPKAPVALEPELIGRDQHELTQD